MPNRSIFDHSRLLKVLPFWHIHKIKNNILEHYAIMFSSGNGDFMLSKISSLSYS